MRTHSERLSIMSRWLECLRSVRLVLQKMIVLRICVEWLTPIPHNIDVLLGVVAAIITYFGYDGRYSGHLRS